MIGDLYNVIRSYVCIEKLAPFLEQRKIIDPENCRYFVSQNAFTPDFETQKLNALVIILKKVAKYPSGECVKCLYLSLWDVYEHHDFAGAQQHRDVALYLRKRGKYSNLVVKTYSTKFHSLFLSYSVTIVQALLNKSGKYLHAIMISACSLIILYYRGKFA